MHAHHWNLCFSDPASFLLAADAVLVGQHGEASVEYLRHLVFLHARHARQALRDAFARAS